LCSYSKLGLESSACLYRRLFYCLLIVSYVERGGRVIKRELNKLAVPEKVVVVDIGFELKNSTVWSQFYGEELEKTLDSAKMKKI
jgi:hypothetical protein